jgi:CRP-like cAMP-binding protein
MHDRLINYINSQLTTKLTADEINVIKSTFVPKKIRKHQYLLQEGEVCKVAGFIVSGALKQYTIDDTGKENILGLYIENWWAGDRESFTNNTPSPYFIDAFEATEMLVVSKADAEEKLINQRFMHDLLRVLSERQALQLLKRVHATKSLNAEQRFAEFEKNYPEFMQRFPQHIIASYLGMTKETLSRIRANALKK